jgi:hypothetical protein
MTEPMHAWKVAGRACAVTAWALWVVVQVVADDPFPPKISVSQYGVGPHGWLFSVWVVVLASAPLLLLRYRPVPGPARWLLAVGYAGSLLMAFVRTDEGGPQMSAQAKVHMAGAIPAMVALPLGIVTVMWFAAPAWRFVSWVLAALATVSGIAILLAAVGVDDTGMGPASSWAFWQGVSIVIDMILVSVYAIAVETVRPP